MTKTVTLEQAIASLAELLKEVQQGAEIIVTANNTPIAHILPASRPSRVLGAQAGLVWLSDDFDAELPDTFWLGEP